MQIVSNGDDLHEMSNPFLGGKNKKNIIIFSSAGLAKSGRGYAALKAIIIMQ